jgi:ribosome biogenesis protein SLX9
MERLRGSQSPHSRSHNRRLRRKEKEQLASGMADLKAALGAIDDSVEKVQRPGITSARRRDPSKSASGESGIELGKIGEGRGVPLSKAQRKQVL